MLGFDELQPVDPERPIFHVMPESGWMNDPNGPCVFNGKYHLFYQHIPDGCEWDFGIVWGHVVSTDMVHWQHVAMALEPSKGWLDADGCFSGCALTDTDGTPTILYTGVRLRNNADCGPLPPPELDLNLPFVESQCVATACKTGDRHLERWQKNDVPMIAFAPPPPPGTEGCQWVGWRDPFIFEFKGQDGHKEWGMLMGSGRKVLGGAIMIYRSQELHSGWRFEGWLCEAETADTGLMWECPLLAPLDFVKESPLHRRSLSGFLSIPEDRGGSDTGGESPTHHPPEALTDAGEPVPNEVEQPERQSMEHPHRHSSEHEPLSRVSFSLSTSRRTSTDGQEGRPPRLSEGWEAQPSDRLAQAEYDELPTATSDEATISEANLMRRVSQLRLAQDEEGSSRPSGVGWRPSLQPPPDESQEERMPMSDHPSDPGLRVNLHRTSTVGHPPSTSGQDSHGSSPLTEEALLGRSALGPRVSFSADTERSPPLSPTSTHSHPASTQAAYQRRRSHNFAEQQYTHLLCISPDAPTNPVLYWLGNMSANPTRFLLEGAKGPLHLDLGDVLYAPNLMIDAEGRYVLWGWLQERRKVGSYDYAGCLGVPRVMHLRGDRLIQEPAPEVDRLRCGHCLSRSHLIVRPDRSTPLAACGDGLAIDLTLHLERHTCKAAGLLVRSWVASEGNAAIIFDWENSRLEVITEDMSNKDGSEEEPDFATSTTLDSDEVARRVGGDVDLRQGETLKMRVLLDHSCVEVFLSTGEVLSTRIYRGEPTGPEPGLELIAFGGNARIGALEAWKVNTIWKQTPDAAARESRQSRDDNWDPMANLFSGMDMHQQQQSVAVGGGGWP
ncbi:hypothetical protein WJX73_002296 [Symbiochloris irregularis]|uniref:beta-fructofuranosidase n=1 Tax=Symbiochloris irregularis TaxID=706552 RepID=A0AAW1PX54_9CHLO